MSHEVVAMNSLTTNLHLMMVSFYQPQGRRYKIMIEEGAFPSDQYAVASQVRFHGYDPEDAIIELKPGENAYTLETKDILHAIEENADELALVMLGGVQYYTGQLFDMQSITKKGAEVGAYVGFDLAHAVGNVPLALHAWEVDFAVWCGYKYLNSGPGGVSGIFVHEKHAESPDLPRFAGWWGHNEAERFQMKKGFQPMYGADGWQLSNAAVFAMSAQCASLEIFEEAGIDALRKKSIQLTGFLAFLLEHSAQKSNFFDIITPKEPSERGCQLSLFFHQKGKDVYQAITEAGVIADWREPNVIRIAPVPLYNSFEEVYHFAAIVEEVLNR